VGVGREHAGEERSEKRLGVAHLSRT
jgi:hypothetical protein